MPRKPRIEYAGAIYHVMSRGNRGRAVFEDDADREMFLETLGQACSKTGWIVHCYRRHMQQRVVEIAGSRKPHDLDPDWSKIRRGWCLGEPSFREKLLEHLDHVRLGKKASSLSGTEIHCHNERQAEQLKAKALRVIGLTDSSLKTLPKGCMEKQVLVWFIHTRTSVLSNDLVVIQG